MHNATGGPRLISKNLDIAYAIIPGKSAQVVVPALLGMALFIVAASLVQAPIRFLAPSVMLIALLGCCSITGDVMAPITTGGFAGLGIWLREHGFAVVAVVIGLMLGPIAEAGLLRLFQASGGDPGFLLRRPIAIVILLLLVLALFYPLLRSRARNLRARRRPATGRTAAANPERSP